MNEQEGKGIITLLKKVGLEAQGVKLMEIEFDWAKACISEWNNGLICPFYLFRYTTEMCGHGV